jgi:hypothetical protein
LSIVGEINVIGIARLQAIHSVIAWGGALNSWWCAKTRELQCGRTSQVVSSQVFSHQYNRVRGVVLSHQLYKTDTVLLALQVGVSSVKPLLEAVTVVMFMASEKLKCTWVFRSTAVVFNAGRLEISVGAVVSGAICFAEISAVLLQVLLEVEAICNQFPNENRLCFTKLAIGEVYFKWRPAHCLALAQKYARDTLPISEALEHTWERLLAFTTAATIEAALGQGAQAPSYAQAARTWLQDRNLPPEERVQCLMAMAAALEVNAQTEAGIEHLRQALSLAQELGVQRLFHATRLELARFKTAR